MKSYKFFTLLAAAFLLMIAAPRVFADTSTNLVTITGPMVCGKCTLHITSKCQNVVQVQQDGKTVNYFLTMNDVSKNVHGDICGGGSENVTVTGTVKKKGGQEVMTPTKIVVNKS